MMERKGRKRKMCPSEDFLERLEKKTIVYRCVHKEMWGVLSLRPTFEEWRSDIEFCTRGEKCGSVKFVFKDTGWHGEEQGTAWRVKNGSSA